ncbi:DUF4084 domain-containing protein [Marinilactibacillus psychrotolerans]|uniref:DUF4084 domain-containing protein n=2 Tax=Marinilactibacillus psychrotolerans TaxID=191770 RepID=UPI0039AFC106
MTIKKENRLWLIALISFIIMYFLWIFIWRDQELVRTTGNNLFSIVGILFPNFWLFRALIRSKSKKDKLYWLLLFLSTCNYLIAEISWFYIETILSSDIGSTGIYDLFYFFSILFYFTAFLYRILSLDNKMMLLKSFFDISIIMIVSITFSWHYILEPFIQNVDSSFFSLIFTLFYPISDLLLIFCASIFYLNGERYFPKYLLYYILTGLAIQIFVDSLYLFENAEGIYYSGSWYDPLFLIPIMLIGYTSLIERDSVIKKAGKNPKVNKESASIFQLILPYFLVAFLFVFMIKNSSGLNILSIGSGLSIFLVIVRQFIVISENRKLVNQYHQKTEELELSEERYRSLFEYNPDSVFSIDLKGKIESMNSVGASLLGGDKDTLIGSSITSFVDEQYLEETKENFSKVNSGWISNHEFTIKDHDQKQLWIDMTHIPILVKDDLVGSFGIGRDITDKKLNEEKILFYAYHDYLTGLGNRRLFEENLAHLLEKAEAENLTFAILFIDLDNFKEINDKYGHELGDKLLIALAKKLTSLDVDSDFVARMGGDEFTIVIQNILEYNVQEKIAEVSQVLNKTYSFDQIEIFCTSSIGFAYYPSDGTTLTELLSKADNAMYRVKKNRKLENDSLDFPDKSS